MKAPADAVFGEEVVIFPVSGGLSLVDLNVVPSSPRIFTSLNLIAPIPTF